MKKKDKKILNRKDIPTFNLGVKIPIKRAELHIRGEGKMKKVSVRYTQVHLTTLLRDLPFIITRYGKSVAIVKKYKHKKRSTTT